MSISEISIKRPVFAWMLMTLFIVFGGIGFMRMGVSQLPDVDFPVVTVSANLEGAAPEVMETEVVDVIEGAVMTIQGIKSLSSSSKQGSASVSIEFNLDTNIDNAVQEVQNKIAGATKHLPDNMDPVQVSKTNPEDNPIMWLNVYSNKHTQRELMIYVKDTLKDQFSTVQGVGDIFLGGYLEPNLRVWVSNEKLNQYSLTASDVLNAIRNEHIEVPAGQVETLKKDFNVRVLGEAQSVDEFEKILINSRGGAPNYTPIPLKSVARIEEGLQDVVRISRAMGGTAVGLGIRKQRGSNAVSVAQEVRKRMESVSKNLPDGMKMGVVFDSTKFIEESVGELNFTLILSALLTAVVCWGFLGSISSTINVVLAIPTSIVGTFFVLYFSGFTLNTFTLLGLSLAIGIVVDDAIMVLENIVRHREMGKPRMQAALDGANEITFAAIAATIAIVAIFLPVAFMKGIIGKFFYQFGVTMTVAVLLSLVEALTLTPMRCSQFLDTGQRKTRLGRGVEKAWHQMAAFYEKILHWALDHRWQVVVMSLVFFCVSIFSIKFIRKEFVPSQDQSRFMLRLQTPVGSSIHYTDEKFKEVEKLIMGVPEIEKYFAAVGGFGGGESNSGVVFITLKPQHDRKKSQSEVMEQVRRQVQKIEDLKVFAQDLSLQSFAASRGYPIEFNIRGPDWNKLAELSESLKKKIEEADIVTDLDTDYRTGMPEYRIVPDRNSASIRGVSISTIAETVNALVGGVVAGKYPRAGHRDDIRVRLVEEDRNTLESLKKIYVRNNRGELVLLDHVVKIEQKPSLMSISRKDRQRAISIYANVKPGHSQATVLEQIEKIADASLPDGYSAVFSGSTQTFKESFQSLIFALVLGLLVSYMVLASQFNSFIDPVTVLIALPFSLTGAFLALLVTGQSLNVFSMIGLVLLMGIVKKNSILLVDFTNQARESGGEKMTVREALLQACPKRVRPIVMTSVATIAGAIPPALAIGPGAETRIPMALAIVGGVLVSTVLTLLVVPCVYSLFAKKVALAKS